MLDKVAREFILSMLEIMGLPQSPFVVEALLSKLGALHPRFYNEVMVSLMDNQNQFMKPIEKISSAIQKTVDRYCTPESVEDIVSYLKRQYRGKVISDHVNGVFKQGVKIAVSVDGSNLINLYNGENLSDSDALEVYTWSLNNFEKLGVINGHSYDHTKQIPIMQDDEANNEIELTEIKTLAGSLRVQK